MNGTENQALLLLKREKGIQALEQMLKSDTKRFAELGPSLMEARKKGEHASLSGLVKDEFGLEDIGEFFDIVSRHQAAFDPNKTMDELAQTLPATVSWIVPEVVREAIERGVRQQAFYPDLTAFTEVRNTTSVLMPKVNVGAAVPAIRGEGETIPVSTITYGQKTVYIKERSGGFEGTRELVKYSSLNFLANWSASYGIRFGHAMDGLWVDCLYNGDLDAAGTAYQADTPPARVGGHSGAGGIAALVYEDFLYIVLRMSTCGFRPSALLCGEAAALKILSLDEFKTPYSGSPIIRVDTRGFTIPSMYNLYVHNDVPANQILIVDPTQALIQFTAAELEIEREYSAKNRIFGEYVTYTTGPAVFQPGARVRLDKSVAFGAVDFPAAYNSESLTL